MKETVLITGANGSVAKNLAKMLQKDYSVRFLTRKKTRENEFEWNITENKIDAEALKDTDHIIHLAGANIAEKPWTDDRKKEIISSRIDSANLILNTLKEKNIKVKSFISASAVGIYGAVTSQKIFTENDTPGNDFLSDVVKKWEAAADRFKNENVADRVVKVRTPIVLAADEGALKKMAIPVKLGIGAPLGSGKQYMPWIHIEDLSSIYRFFLENQIDGAFNASAPEHTGNEKFTKEIAEVLKKPMFMPNIPGFMIKLIFGELSLALLEGSRTSSEKLLAEGFQFQYPALKEALQNLLLKNQ